MMPYIEWAKLRSSARFNLATSGVENFPLRELPARIEDLEITGPGLYGYSELRERLVRKTGAPDESLVLSIGTSMANFIALGALIESGDDVLIEQPTYQPMLHIAEWLGAKVRRVPRDPANAWKIDINHLRKLVRPETKLIVLSNLHNPSSGLIAEDEMRAIGALGPRVFVDEVYLEAMFDQPQRSAFSLGDNFTITNSLTKAYGLSGLRCGWILTQPDLVSSMHALVDLTYGVPAHSAERLSVIALDHLSHIAQRARDLLAHNRKLVNAFLAAHEAQLECAPSEFGTCVAPHLRNGSVDEFCDVLRNEFETSVVPGHFFEAPEHFRIGLGGPTEILEPGLERIASALRCHSKRSRDISR
jgi:aspartate/methionine/tyrosine aminotransferase